MGTWGVNVCSALDADATASCCFSEDKLKKNVLPIFHSKNAVMI